MNYRNHYLYNKYIYVIVYVYHTYIYNYIYMYCVYNNDVKKLIHNMYVYVYSATTFI